MSETVTDEREILFVLSDARSGSTLLDQLLGAHEEIVSVGELHWLDAYAKEDRSLYNPVHPLVCACGERVADCEFWTGVASRVSKPLGAMRMRPWTLDWRGPKSDGARRRLEGLRAIPGRVLARYPQVFRSALVQRVFRGRELADDVVALGDAIASVADSRYVVDSSKSPYRFRATYDRYPDRVRAIVLVRDYRAVAYSKSKRGRSLESAALQWKRKLRQVQALTAGLREDRKYSLTYEALCENPKQELVKICDFLGLEFSPDMLERPVAGVHHIGGSPSKFDASKRKISLDRAYLRALDEATLSRLGELVGDAADEWGY